MPTIPSQHTVGDEGHTTDHNAIVDVLTDHEQKIAGIQAAQPGYLVNTGNNVITVTNPSGVAESVIIPASGSRDSAAYIKGVTYNGRRTFALDTYGQPRLGAASVNDVPLIVWGYSSGQATDLQRWRKLEGGADVARIDKDGNFYAPNITPTAWTALTMASGIIHAPGLGSPPQYRLVGDMVELRGSFKKTSGDFNVSPSDVGTLPVGARPPYPHVSITAANLVNDEAYIRLTVEVSGLIRFYFRSATYTPEWASLDNIRFSKST